MTSPGLLGPSTCSRSLSSTLKTPSPVPVLRPPYQKGGFGWWVSTSTLGAGVLPHHTLSRALPCPVSRGGGWSLGPRGELSLVFLPWGGSGHPQEHFGVLRTNLGTLATAHGVWLEGFK